jgi:hypothetical protein
VAKNLRLRPLGDLAVQNRFSKPKWKVEWKIDGNNFPLGRLGIAKIVGKIAHQLSGKWNLLSTPKNSEWKIGKAERSPTLSRLRHSERAYYSLAEILRGRKMSSQTIDKKMDDKKMYRQRSRRFPIFMSIIFLSSFRLTARLYAHQLAEIDSQYNLPLVAINDFSFFTTARSYVEKCVKVIFHSRDAKPSFSRRLSHNTFH